MLTFYDILRQIYFILTVLEMILRKFPVVWWLNQVSTTCNKEATGLTRSVKTNHTGTFIRELRVAATARDYSLQNCTQECRDYSPGQGLSPKPMRILGVFSQDFCF